MHLHTFAIIALIAGILTVAIDSFGTQKRPIASGDWHDAQNWVTAAGAQTGIPDSTDDVFLANGVDIRYSAAVLPDNRTIQSLRIGAQDQSGATLRVTGGTLTVAQTFNIGEEPGAVGSLLLSHGTIHGHTIYLGRRVDGGRTEGHFTQTGGSVALTGGFMVGAASALQNAENVNGTALITNGGFSAAGIYVGGIGGNPERGTGKLIVGSNGNVRTTSSGGDAGAFSLRSTGTLEARIGSNGAFRPMDFTSGFTQFISGSTLTIDGSAMGFTNRQRPIVIAAFQSVRATQSNIELLNFAGGLSPEIRWNSRSLVLYPNGAPPWNEGMPVELNLGNHQFITDQFTLENVPVISLWDAPFPTADTSNAAGFPRADDVDVFTVWQPSASSDDWAFNHFAALVYYEGRFFAKWGNHPYGENAPGQRILYSWSDDDGKTWTQPAELFPQPGPAHPPGEGERLHMGPDRWVLVDEKLYSVSYVISNIVYPIARRVYPDGSTGEAFLLRSIPENTILPVFLRDSENINVIPSAADSINRWYHRNTVSSWWATFIEGLPRYSIDGASMIEPVTFETQEHGKIALMRSMPFTLADSHANGRIYISFKDDSDNWSIPYPTDIPDVPSRSEIIVFPDGKTLLIGNQIAHEFDVFLERYRVRDPMTISISHDGIRFQDVYAVRTGAPLYRIPGIQNRTRGFAYPSSVVRGDFLYSLYSVGKEDMEILRVPLSGLGISTSFSHYMQWCSQYGLTGYAAHPSGSMNPQGEPTLLRYAFDIDPFNPDPMPGILTVDAIYDPQEVLHGRISLVLPTNRPELEFHLELSSDLEHWVTSAQIDGHLEILETYEVEILERKQMGPSTERILFSTMEPLAKCFARITIKFQE